MKPSFFKSLLLAAFAAFWVAAPSTSLQARADAATVTAVATTVDPYGELADKVSDTSEALADALDKAASDPKTLDKLMKALDKAGIKGGLTDKLGKLSKIKGVAGALSKVITAIKVGATGVTLVEAYNKGDKAGFKAAAADAMTELAGTLVSSAVTMAISAAGTAITGAFALTGPGALIVGGVCLVGGWYASDKAKDAVTKAISDGAMRKAFEDVAEALWNSMKGEDGSGNDGGGDDPFDSAPEGGGSQSGKSGYKGLKTFKLVD